MADLFQSLKSPAGKTPQTSRPLADRIRPRTLDEVAGQEEVTGPDSPLRKILETGSLPSLILWGPPGSGKTTVARLISQMTRMHFVAFSAVMAGIKEIRAVIEAAHGERDLNGRGTILFVDEIHRFNRAQQDAFLPHIEDGTIILIGATTENPSFEVNSALLSRCRVVTLNPLGVETIKTILQRALADKEQGLGNQAIQLGESVADLIANISNGDARTALNLLELACLSTPKDKSGARVVTPDHVKKSAQKRHMVYDRDGEEHYNIVSAFIKSMRGSDPDAALYWLARMIEAGEDPLFIARRMVILASEDVGNADPQALGMAVAVKDAVDFIGMPEGFIPLAQAATYLATAPKSNASYKGYLAAAADVKNLPNDPVPLHLRNAPTALMKDLGYGKDYQYSHDAPEAIDTQDYLPDNVKGKKYYQPKGMGFEQEIIKRMDHRGKKRIKENS